MNLFIFILNEVKTGVEVKNMCDTLNKMKGKNAVEILREYYGKDTIPIDIVAVAENIGIQLKSVDFTNLEKSDVFREKVKKKGRILGAVQVKDDDVIISYSSILPPNKDYENLTEIQKTNRLINRQRFTIAHEIAHCCLGHMNDMDNRNGSHIEYRTEQESYTDPREFNANIFAGKLLMPTKYMQDVAHILHYNVSLSVLSKFFRVSKSVAKARLEYLIDSAELPSYTVIYD